MDGRFALHKCGSNRHIANAGKTYKFKRKYSLLGNQAIVPFSFDCPKNLAVRKAAPTDRIIVRILTIIEKIIVLTQLAYIKKDNIFFCYFKHVMPRIILHLKIILLTSYPRYVSLL